MLSSPSTALATLLKPAHVALPSTALLLVISVTPATHLRSIVMLYANSGRLDITASLRVIRCKIAMSGKIGPRVGGLPAATAAAAEPATDAPTPPTTMTTRADERGVRGKAPASASFTEKSGSVRSSVVSLASTGEGGGEGGGGDGGGEGGGGDGAKGANKSATAYGLAPGQSRVLPELSFNSFCTDKRHSVRGDVTGETRCKKAVWRQAVMARGEAVVVCERIGTSRQVASLWRAHMIAEMRWVAAKIPSRLAGPGVVHPDHRGPIKAGRCGAACDVQHRTTS